MHHRFSRKREAIYNCLCSSDTHPTADWIFQQLRSEYPDLSLGTVYRNLTQLREAGLIQSLGTVDGLERFDADTYPHSHFVCSSCGAVLDLELQFPEELTRQAEAALGCNVTATSLRLVGQCAKCRRRETQ